MRDQAEQLRNIIKRNQLKSNKVARVITVTSGKGGVGKSNTSVNLAIQLKKLGHRVIILDADFGLANIEVILGIVPKYNLCDMIEDNRNIKDIITVGPLGVGFISGGSAINKLLRLSKEDINILINNLTQLDDLADYIIIDTGAGISDSVMEFVTFGSDVLVIVTPEPTSLMDAYSLLKMLTKNPSFDQKNTKVRIITNRAKSSQEGKVVFEKLNSVVTKFISLPITFLGTILEDENVSKAVIKQQPVSLANPMTKAAKSFEEITKELDGINTQQETTDRKGIAKLFSNYINRQIYK